MPSNWSAGLRPGADDGPWPRGLTTAPPPLLRFTESCPPLHTCEVQESASPLAGSETDAPSAWFRLRASLRRNDPWSLALRLSQPSPVLGPANSAGRGRRCALGLHNARPGYADGYAGRFTSLMSRSRRRPYSTKFLRVASSLAVEAASWKTTTMWGSMLMPAS